MNRTRTVLRAARPQRVKCLRKRALAEPDWLPSTAHLPSIPSLEARAAGGEDNARDWPESDTTSSTETEVKNEIGRRRIWAQRQNTRRRRYLDSAEGSWSQGLTVLEAQAVKQGSQKQHLREWNELLRGVKVTADEARAHSGNDLDSIIVKHFEKLFFEKSTRRGE